MDKERHKGMGIKMKEQVQNYLDAARGVMEFINTRKVQGEEGIYWSLQDAAEGREIYYDQITMYAGSSGIICFLLGLYDATKEETYLTQAKEAAKYIIWRWNHDRSLKRNFSQYAFSSGWCGAGFALLRLYEVAKEEIYKETAASIADQTISDAKQDPSGKGYYWSDFPGIVGNAGTILFLLFASRQLQEDRWKQFAIEAGYAYLSKGRDMGNGYLCYQGINPDYFGAGKDYVDPNFPMGTAGIGFTLLRLYEESGEEIFLDAVKGVPEYMGSVAVPMKYGKLLPHGLPDRPNLFYLGYCHGPAGTTRFYYKLQQVTGKDRYGRAICNLVQGLEDTGAPEVRTPGYWNTYNMCCGTAGLLNMYLGLWAAYGQESYLDMARRCGKVILDGAKYDQNAEGKTLVKWEFALDRVAPDKVTTPIGCFDGAAGIGLALLQLYGAERGAFHAKRFLDDPFPERNNSH